MNEASMYPTPSDYEFSAFGLFWKFKAEKCFKWTGQEWVRSLMRLDDFKKSNRVYPPVAGEKQ